MIEEGRTDFDLSITIPNTKSRSNLKYSANYVSSVLWFLAYKAFW
tara:strand:- start:1 stop:135 length:135 start_codon:yes stop_codon:yes gene_type:complete